MTSTRAKAKQTGKGPRSVPIIAIVFGLIAVALIAAVVFGGGSSSQTTEYGTVEFDTVLPPMPQSQTMDTSATGLVAPELKGQDFNGHEVTITNDGHAKAVVFLAHWCPHCQQEVPRVQQWLNETGGVPGVDLYSVATAINSARPNYPPSKWLEREGWTVPVIRDDENNSALIAYGAGGFPYWVFINADGTVALRTSGETTIDQLTTVLEGLKKG